MLTAPHLRGADARGYEIRAAAELARRWREACSGVAQEDPMLLILAAIIAIAWLLGFTVFHVASGAIHILIVIALIVAIVHFVQGRRAPLP